MSPELIQNQNTLNNLNFNPELSDIFSLGMTFLRISL